MEAGNRLYDSKLYWALFYFSVVVSGIVSISALAPLVGTPIGFTSSAVELEISAIMPIISGKSV